MLLHLATFCPLLGLRPCCFRIGPCAQALCWSGPRSDCPRGWEADGKPAGRQMDDPYCRDIRLTLSRLYFGRPNFKSTGTLQRETKSSAYDPWDAGENGAIPGRPRQLPAAQLLTSLSLAHAAAVCASCSHFWPHRVSTLALASCSMIGPLEPASLRHICLLLT